jgi:hypothetical protein
MSWAKCGHEDAVSKAQRRGELPERLATHVAECAVCREIVEAARWMRSVAHDTARIDNVPAAELVWSRARYAERMEQAARKRRTLEWAEICSGAAVPVGLAGWVAWNWYGVEAQAAQLLEGQLPQFPLAIYAIANVAPALLFLAAISLAYPLLVRD